MENNSKFITSILIIVIVLGAGWYFLMTRPLTPSGAGAVTTEIEKGIVVTKTDISQGSPSKLPQGFPSSIPVETTNILESYRAVYTERGVTQYTVSYTSVKGRDALWDTYNTYMLGAGYVMDPTATSRSLGQISGTDTKNDSLSVIVSTRDGSTLVQISFLDRK